MQPPLPPGFHLRNAAEADLPAIVAIYNSIVPGRQVTADLEPVTVEQRRPWFDAHQTPTRPIWVLTDNSREAATERPQPLGSNRGEARAEHRVVAWVSFDTFYARAAYDGTAMLAIYLAESHRGRGLGALLLQIAIARAPSLKLHTLLGYIFAHNEPSLRLFARHGFERWAHLPRVCVLDGVDRDVIIMGRRVVA
jgi:phosphinothricin acetyltransferase